MKKILAVFLLVVLVITCIALCACQTNIGKYLDSTYDPYNSLLTNAQDVDALLGFTVVKSVGKLVLLKNEKLSRFVVYNIELNTIVYDVTSSSDKIFIDLYSVGYGKVTVFTVNDNYLSNNYYGSCQLYSETGRIIASTRKRVLSQIDETISIRSILDMIIFDDTCYRIKDSAKEWIYNGTEWPAGPAIVKAFTVNELKEYNWDVDVKAGKNYYYFDSAAKRICAYDENLDLIAVKYLPSFAQDIVRGVIDENIVMYQYLVELPDSALEYDIADNGTKYRMVTQTFNIKSHKTTDIKCDYRLEEIYGYLGTERFVKSIPYLKHIGIAAEGYDVIMNRLDESIGNKRILSISKTGKVDVVFNDLKLDMIGIPIPITVDRYLCYTASDICLLIDGRGKIIGEINEIPVLTRKHIYIGNTIYDYNLKKLRDVSKFTYVGHTADLLFFADAGDVTYYFNDGFADMTQISKTSSITLFNDYYSIAKVSDFGVTTYYYNAAGASLCSTLCNYSEVAHCNGIYLLQGMLSGGQSRYLRLS